MALEVEPHSVTMVHHEDALVNCVALPWTRASLVTNFSTTSASYRRLTDSFALGHLTFAFLGPLIEAMKVLVHIVSFHGLLARLAKKCPRFVLTQLATRVKMSVALF